MMVPRMQKAFSRRYWSAYASRACLIGVQAFDVKLLDFLVCPLSKAPLRCACMERKPVGMLQCVQQEAYMKGPCLQVGRSRLRTGV